MDDAAQQHCSVLPILIAALLHKAVRYFERFDDSANRRGLDRADKSRKIHRIKHSLSTAVRQAVSNMEAHRHRLGMKTKPPSGKLNCGLFGAGRFFNYAYVPALNQKDSPLAITGLLARNGAKFEASRRGLRYTTDHFTDLDAMLASGIEAALIVLPNHLHFTTAKAALERGLHVFCEKPLTNSVADALILKALAARAGRVLMVDFNQRYLARNRLLADLVARKPLGKIKSVHAFHNQDFRGLASFGELHRDRTGGGVIHNAGIHFINLLLHWFGPPERVRAVFENRALPPDCGEDTAHCEFWFRDGIAATLDASFANAVDTTYERVRFISEDGEMTSDLKKGNILCKPAGKPEFKIPCRPEIIVDSVYNALRHFAACVKNHSQPETDVNDFIQTLKTVEALTLSARRGTEVTLAEIENNYV
jgi:predicted dehydrogenase